MLDEKIKYRILRRNIKYPRIEFKNGDLEIIAPLSFDTSSLIKKHKKWILSKKQFINNSLKKINKIKLIKRSNELFKDLINKFSKDSEIILNVKPKKIYYRLMKTKWASCSTKKNLTLNMLLKYLPKNLIRYVVFHEFCHLIIPYHNNKFWFLVSKKFGNPELFEKKLFSYWFLLKKLNKF